LFAFGGNGPLFAAGMAQALQMTHIIMPPSPGLFSAFGLLYADVEHHYSRTFRRLLNQVDISALNQAWRELEQQALAQLARDDFSGARTRLQRSASLHYQGQLFELTVAAPAGELDETALAGLEEAFGQEHERTYGHRAGPEEPVELVNIQVVAQGIPERSSVPDRLAAAAREEHSIPPRQAYFGTDYGWLSTPVLRRKEVTAPRQGPCIIEEYDATCVIPPDATVQPDPYGNLVMRL
jgi:N-methylhydantoinase A